MGVFVFAFASCVSAMQPGGFARAEFAPTPGSIQQAGGGAGLSLVVSTHIFLGWYTEGEYFSKAVSSKTPSPFNIMDV